MRRASQKLGQERSWGGFWRRLLMTITSLATSPPWLMDRWLRWIVFLKSGSGHFLILIFTFFQVLFNCREEMMQNKKNKWIVSSSHSKTNKDLVLKRVVEDLGSISSWVDIPAFCVHPIINHFARNKFCQWMCAYEFNKCVHMNSITVCSINVRSINVCSINVSSINVCSIKCFRATPCPLVCAVGQNYEPLK